MGGVKLNQKRDQKRDQSKKEVHVETLRTRAMLRKQGDIVEDDLDNDFSFFNDSKNFFESIKKVFQKVINKNNSTHQSIEELKGGYSWKVQVSDELEQITKHLDSSKSKENEDNKDNKEGKYSQNVEKKNPLSR